MKAIVTEAIIASFSTANDKSLRFRGSTPELTDTEAVALMGMRGINVRLLIEPIDYPTDGKTEVKSKLDNKTMSQRCRAVLFVAWQQGVDAREGEEFDEFYRRQYEHIIDTWKAKLKD